MNPKNPSNLFPAGRQDGWDTMRQNVAEARQQIAQAKENAVASPQSGSPPPPTAGGPKPTPTPSDKR